MASIGQAIGGRVLPLAGVVAAGLAVAAMAGAGYRLLLLIGLGFGITLEGLRFGFAGPRRAFIPRREPTGLAAQLLAAGLVAAVAMPLLGSDDHRDHSGCIPGYRLAERTLLAHPCTVAPAE